VVIQLATCKALNIVFQHLVLCVICSIILCFCQILCGTLQQLGVVPSCDMEPASHVVNIPFCDVRIIPCLNGCKSYLISGNPLLHSLEHPTIISLHAQVFEQLRHLVGIILGTVTGEVCCYTLVMKSKTLQILCQQIDGIFASVP